MIATAGNARKTTVAHVQEVGSEARERITILSGSGADAHVLGEAKCKDGAPERRLFDGGSNDVRAIAVFDDRQGLRSE